MKINFKMYRDTQYISIDFRVRNLHDNLFVQKNLSQLYQQKEEKLLERLQNTSKNLEAANKTLV